MIHFIYCFTAAIALVLIVFFLHYLYPRKHKTIVRKYHEVDDTFITDSLDNYAWRNQSNKN